MARYNTRIRPARSRYRAPRARAVRGGGRMTGSMGYVSPIYGREQSTGAMALSGTARALWRYRSELAPVAGTALAFATGAYLHAAHPAAWPIALGAAGAGAGWFLRYGHKAGLDRVIERQYAAAVTSGTGAFLAADDIFGIGKLLAYIGLAAGLAAAVPWWTHRRRRAKVRVDRAIAAWPDLAEDAGLPGSKIIGAVVHTWGTTFKLRMRRGQHAEHATRAVKAIESVFDTRPGAVFIEVDKVHTRNVLVRVVDTDPFEQTLEHPCPKPGTVSVTDPWPIGLYRDAARVETAIFGLHTLVIGQTGAGKSSILEGFLATYGGAPDQVLIGVDLAGGATLEAWAPAFRNIVTDPRSAEELFNRILNAVVYRERLLAKTKAEAAKAGKPTPDSLEPSKRLPAMRVIVDEYADLLSAIPDADTVLERLAKRARKTAIFLMFLSQNGNVTELGSGTLRAQFRSVFGLAVRDTTAAQAIFGPGCGREGWAPERITVPGGFYLKDPTHRDAKLGKSFYLSPEQRARVVTALARHGRTQLDAGTANALGIPEDELGEGWREAAARPAPEPGPTGPAPSPSTEPAPEDYLEVVFDPETDGPQPDDQSGPPEPVSAPAFSIPAPRRPAEQENAEPADSTARVLALLQEAGGHGTTVPQLALATGLKRTRLYEILGELAEAGQAENTRRGRWRALPEDQPADYGT